MTSRYRLLTAAALAASTALTAPARAEPQVELLHMWTSGDSAAALGALKDRFVAAGGTWIDSSAGGATSGQMATLRARVLAGDAPTASQLEGTNITEWARAGALADLNEVAAADNWDEHMPEALKRVMAYDGKYVAVPLNIHRINWIYYNPTLLAELGLEFPKTWPELHAAVLKAKEAGYTGFDHGSRPWQDALLYEGIVLSIGGVEFYKKAFYDLDEASLRSDTMLEIFTALRDLSGTLNEGYPGRHYSESLKAVGGKEALFTMMGDWAVANFVSAGYVHGVDYECAAVPQADGRRPFTVNSDAFGFFTQKDPDRIEGQKIIARMVFEPQTQLEFNLKKGSIPARLGLDLEGFAPCQLKAVEEIDAAVADDALLMSFVQSMAQPEAIKGAAVEVITTFVATPSITPAEGVTRLADAIMAAKD